MAKAKGKKGSGQSMADKMRDRASTRESSGRGGVKFTFPVGAEIKFFKVDKAKTYKLDFIPYEVTDKKHPAGVDVGDLWYQRTIWTHNNIGPEEKSYLCLKSVGKKCPICEYRAQLVKSADADEDLIKSLNSKERELFQVIDLDNEKAGIQLWEFSYHLFGKKLEEEIREDDEDGYKAGFADLEGGSTLKIRFGSKKMGKNEFFEATRIDFEERDDYGEDILDDVLCLDEILNVLDYEKLEAIFLDTETEEVEEKPARGRGGRGKEKEEDEKPARGGRGRGKKDEEEEKEEKSSRSSRGKKEEKEEAPSRGRGRNKEKEEEPEEKPSRGGRASRGKEKEEEKPKRGAKGKKEEPELAEDECPAGGEFGVDEGEFDECIDCPNWDACKELSDEAKEEKKPAKRGGRR